MARALISSDALVVLSTVAGERRIAIELDLGTEPTRVLKLKLAKYRELVDLQVVQEIHHHMMAASMNASLSGGSAAEGHAGATFLP